MTLFRSESEGYNDAPRRTEAGHLRGSRADAGAAVAASNRIARLTMKMTVIRPGSDDVSREIPYCHSHCKQGHAVSRRDFRMNRCGRGEL